MLGVGVRVEGAVSIGPCTTGWMTFGNPEVKAGGEGLKMGACETTYWN